MPAAGDSALVQTPHLLGHIKKVILDVTFDSGDGSFTATALENKIDGFLLRAVTDPGGTAPTNGYDITLIDGMGVDVLQGCLLDRSNATTEDVAIVYSGTENHPVVAPSDTLTLTITGNSVKSATTQIVLWYSLAMD
jgi:hypothetical protein